MLAVPVTVVRHDPAEMGRIGADLAYARLDGEDALPQRHTIACELVPRGSGEVPVR
jgi:LacI family transcriptional regulator